MLLNSLALLFYLNNVLYWQVAMLPRYSQFLPESCSVCRWMTLRDLISSVLLTYRPHDCQTEDGWISSRNLLKRNWFLCKASWIKYHRLQQIWCSDFMSLLRNFIQGWHYEERKKRCSNLLKLEIILYNVTMSQWKKKMQQATSTNSFKIVKWS